MPDYTYTCRYPNLIIALTGLPPVRITEDEWPIIAESALSYSKCHSNEKAFWELTVRKHNDGRTIVYGVYYDYCQHESDLNISGGELVAADASTEAIIAAILRVGADLENHIPDGFSWGREYFPRFVYQCIADLFESGRGRRNNPVSE